MKRNRCEYEFIQLELNSKYDCSYLKIANKDNYLIATKCNHAREDLSKIICFTLQIITISLYQKSKNTNFLVGLL